MLKFLCTLLRFLCNSIEILICGIGGLSFAVITGIVCLLGPPAYIVAVAAAWAVGISAVLLAVYSVVVGIFWTIMNIGQILDGIQTFVTIILDAALTPEAGGIFIAVIALKLFCRPRGSCFKT